MMKTKLTLQKPQRNVLWTLLFMMICATLHAQTYRGQDQLTLLPNSFAATIYKLSNAQAIRVNLNNFTRGPVHIRITDEQGRLYYDERTYTARYRRSFNLSDLPSGVFTVQLLKHDWEVTQQFRIEPPTDTKISMLNEVAVNLYRNDRKPLIADQ